MYPQPDYVTMVLELAFDVDARLQLFVDELNKMGTKTSADREQPENDIRGGQEEMSNSIVNGITAMETKISAGQGEFEGRMTDMLDKHIKNGTTTVEQIPRNSEMNSTANYERRGGTSEWHNKIAK
jgi:hypothetical protein